GIAGQIVQGGEIGPGVVQLWVRFLDTELAGRRVAGLGNLVLDVVLAGRRDHEAAGKPALAAWLWLQVEGLFLLHVLGALRRLDGDARLELRRQRLHVGAERLQLDRDGVAGREDPPHVRPQPAVVAFGGAAGDVAGQLGPEALVIRFLELPQPPG